MLAGGMLPLAATLATNEVFDAFQHDSKLKALLHGHSYTAHAIGCSAANTALDLYTDPACNPNFPKAEVQGSNPASSIETKSANEVPSLMELWDEQIVAELSRHDKVQKVVALGMLHNHKLLIMHIECAAAQADITIMQCIAGHKICCMSSECRILMLHKPISLSL